MFDVRNMLQEKTQKSHYNIKLFRDRRQPVAMQT